MRRLEAASPFVRYDGGCAPASSTCWQTRAGETVAVVSHVTPIKILVADALGAPLDAVYRMELSPASVTVLAYYAPMDDEPRRTSLRLFNARPLDAAIRLD